MPLSTQGTSSSSAAIRWAEPERVARDVRAFAASLRRERPEVRRIFWYGSWVTGRPTASSDVDLCVVVAEDERPPRHRIPDYLPDRFSTGVDLVVFTEAEFARLQDWSPAWHRAITAGQWL